MNSKKPDALQYLAENDAELAEQVDLVLIQKTPVEDIVNEAIFRLSEALQGNEVKRINSAIKRLRKIIAENMDENEECDNSTENAEKIPSSDYFIAFEKKAKRRIEDMPIDDNEFIDFTYKTQKLRVSPKNLFNRISIWVFGKPVPAKGKKICISIRDGNNLEEAKMLVEKIDSASEINQSYILKFEEAAGVTVEEMNTGDKNRVAFYIDDIKQERSPNALFTYVSKKQLGSPAPAQGKRFCILLKNGKSIIEAKKLIEKDSVEEISELTFEYISAFEQASKIKLENMIAMDKSNITFSIRGIKKMRSPNALFTYVSRKHLGAPAPAQGKRLCILIRDGFSIEQAKASIEKANEFTELTPEYLLGFEKGAAKRLEEMNTTDHSNVVFYIESVRQERSPAALFIATSRNMFNNATAPALGRQFCIYIREGKTLEEAKSLVEQGEEGEIDRELEKISTLRLEELFSIFADRPGQMKLYLQANYPHLTEQEIDKLILRGFKSFFGGSERKPEYLDYDFSLPSIHIDELPFVTKENTLHISGTAKGAHYVYVSGTGSRKIKVDDQGYFEIIIPLRIGKMNVISLTAVNVDKEARSETAVIEIEQIGTIDDIEELIRLLSGMGKDAIESIKIDPGRYNHIKSRLKHVLIRKFSKSFDAGERYIREMIDGNHSAVIKKMLKEILSEFRKIDKATFPNIRPEEQLYLFQKYCALLIQQHIEQGRPGVILANDPGLGKTRTALAAINGDDAVIIAPNSVVSGWSEEAAKTMKDPDILVMQDMPTSKRKEVLRATTARHRITNIQFIQQHEDDERIELLANENSIIVQDEAHSRANLQSQQTKGMRKLSKIGKFQLLLSATPFKNSKTTRRVLHTLHPDRPEFKSDVAFEKAFPSKDPKALQTVNLLLEEDMIRFTKRDALEEMDPKVPVSKQLHKLPRKEQVPPETMGGFEMSNEQAQVIYEMFLNWSEWTLKYGQYVPNDKAAKLDRIYNGDSLSKRHAYRQVINNPDFVGLDGVSNKKARTLQAIVAKSLKEKRKVEIFCAYNAQANLYAEILKKFKPALYTGVTSKEGWKKENGKPQFFAKDKKGNWLFDKNGYPIPDVNGEPMLAMDYERLSFQNAPDRQVIIATYAAGAVGTTFTAAKTVIKDDLPRDCIEDEQSDDRTHRIDHEHQTHHTINHYHLISSYPKKFLNDMKKRWVVKQPDKTYNEYLSAEEAMVDGEKLDVDAQTAYEAFFEQGTWDEVHFENLKTQRHMMHLILDGIADESILNEDQIKVKGIDD